MLSFIYTVTLVIIFLLILFWPSKGLLIKKRISISDTRRILVEDALKQLYECEYRHQKCSKDILIKSLSVSENEATELLDNLKSKNLIEWKGDVTKLTNEGETYALKIIRIHRLWERYLSEETSVHESRWHEEAEKLEHKISDDEAKRLAAQLGNPLFDPHGDPIPTATGEIPQHKGKSLCEFKVGEIGKILHVEDEPPATYAQIIAEGLNVGMQVRIKESSKERIRFIANGEECLLAPLLAANITVIPIEEEEEFKGEFRTLSFLRTGESAVILGISKACRGQQRRRLMDLGIVPGSEITAELSSLGGDPVAYKIRGTTVALRNQQADQIYIHKIKKESKVA